MENHGAMILTGENLRTQEKNLSSATLSNRNLTWTDPVGNPGLRGERPATNRLSYGKDQGMNIIITVAATDNMLHFKELIYSINTIDTTQ
jgi:hypothetical protein